MNKAIHKSIAFLMAGIVLFTTMSFTVDMHYCGETLVDFSFNQQVETCGMEKAQATKTCEKPMLSEKSCCSDKQLVKEAEDDLKISFDNLSFEQQVFVTSFIYSYNSLFEGAQSSAILYVDYPPPFLERDVQVLHQTFLI